jgi:hypothetical protein
LNDAKIEKDSIETTKLNNRDENYKLFKNEPTQNTKKEKNNKRKTNTKILKLYICYK